ncbi:MAG: acyl-CoA thioesterase [Deltaproteobacteria bacterium]|nr:acyl-CoA thioesterase [Deltaproteobacteria bacterium]
MAYTSVQKIRFDDVDGAGIVYYPRFFHLCHAAMEDFFDDAAPFSYPHMINTMRLGLPSVHIEADFTAPLMYGDVVVVTLAIVHIGSASVRMRYQIRRKRDAALSMTTTITNVMMDLDKKQSLPIPDELRRVFESYLGDGESSGKPG